MLSPPDSQPKNELPQQSKETTLLSLINFVLRYRRYAPFFVALFPEIEETAR
jgi:hypothetical protein